MAEYWVDIESAANQRLGAGPLRAIEFTAVKALSASGRFSFRVLASDPNIGALAPKRVAICRYLDHDGTIRILGGGIIDAINLVAGAGAPVYEVSGNDLAIELRYRSVGALALQSDAAGVTNGPAQIMSLAPSGWTLTGGTTQTPVYVGFDGESVLNGLVRVSERIGEHWRLGSGRQIVWLGLPSAFASSGLRAVQHLADPVGAEVATDVAVIQSLRQLRDAGDVATRVIPRGSGNGSTIVTLAMSTDSAPSGYTMDRATNWLRNDAAEALYGRIERVVDFKELGPLSNTTPDVQAAGNMLLRGAYEYLSQRAAPAEYYELELAGVSQLLEPGTTMRVIYRELHDGAVLFDINQTLNLVEVEQTISEAGLRTTRVQVSTAARLPGDDSAILSDQVQGARIFAAHQQLSASVDNLGWRDEMDDDHDARFRFWLGDEYTSLQRAVFRFRVQPLRSTVKSVGGSSATTSSGGAATPTSSSGGGQTASGGSHLHNTDVLPATPNFTNIGWYQSGGFVGPVSTDGNTYTLQVGVQNTHNHDIAAHTHDVSVPAHTHTVTAAVSMVYGIYQESLSNTLELTDLVITLNGGSNLLSQVVDIGGGWYQIDLTTALVDSVYRPSRESNEIAISTAVAKTARIEAQLTIRGVVQAIAYL